MGDPTGLPTWAEMSDLDRGAALLHLHKRELEGASYAVSDYPCRYIDDPRLVALSPRAASAHAVQVGKSGEEAFELLGADEHDRLYDLALSTGEEIIQSRRPWGVRWAKSGNVSTFDDYALAAAMAADFDGGWGGTLLGREVPGGEWHEWPVELDGPVGEDRAGDDRN